MTKAPNDLASHFRWHGDAFTDGQLIDTVTPRTGHKNETNPDLRAEPVGDPATHPGSWRAVWAYSRKRAVHDGKTLIAQENRAREVIEGQKAARPPPASSRPRAANATWTKPHWHPRGNWPGSKAT